MSRNKGHRGSSRTNLANQAPGSGGRGGRGGGHRGGGRGGRGAGRGGGPPPRADLEDSAPGQAAPTRGGPGRGGSGRGGSGRGGFRGGRRGGGATGMNAVSFDYADLNNGVRVASPLGSGVNTPAGATAAEPPVRPSSLAYRRTSTYRGSRGRPHDSPSSYPVYQGSSRGRGTHGGLGFRRQPEEQGEAAYVGGLGHGRNRPASGRPSSSFLNPVAFVKGTGAGMPRPVGEREETELEEKTTLVVQMEEPIEPTYPTVAAVPPSSTKVIPDTPMTSLSRSEDDAVIEASNVDATFAGNGDGFSTQVEASQEEIVEIANDSTIDGLASQIVAAQPPPAEEQLQFVIDTVGDRDGFAQDALLPEREIEAVLGAQSLTEVGEGVGVEDEEDEVILLPRVADVLSVTSGSMSTRSMPAPPPAPSLAPTVKEMLAEAIAREAGEAANSEEYISISTRGAGRKTKKAAKKERRRARNAARRQGREGPGEPRQDDSDLDWGSEGPPSPGEQGHTYEETENVIEGFPDGLESGDNALDAVMSLRLGQPGRHTRSQTTQGSILQQILATEASSGRRRGGRRRTGAKGWRGGGGTGQNGEDMAVLADYMANVMQSSRDDSDEPSSSTMPPKASAVARNLEDGGGDLPDALLRFASNMEGVGTSGGTWKTIDDLKDDDELRREDQRFAREPANETDSDSGWCTEEDSGEELQAGDQLGSGEGSVDEDDELVDVTNKAEAALIGESEAEESDSSTEFDSSESSLDSEEAEDELAHRGLGAPTPPREKVKRRDKGRGKGKANEDGRALMFRDLEDEEEGEESDDGGMFNGDFAWNDSEVERLIDMDEDNMTPAERKARKKLFKSIANGDFGGDFGGWGDEDEMAIDDDDLLFAAAKRGKKGKKGKGKAWDTDDVWAVELQAQWEKDRATKADRKRARATERRSAEASVYPASLKKKGKGKGKTTSRRKAYGGMDDSSDSASDVASGRKIKNLAALDDQIQNFLFDVAKTTMSLAPMDKKSRMEVHRLAEAYSIKSKSRGKGRDRFTTLIKTSKSGIVVDRRKVEWILRSSGDKSFKAPRDRDGGEGWKRAGKKGPAVSTPRNKDGQQVGFGASKIGADNIGHQLLSKMGWTEGSLIGVSGGIEVPIMAVVKTSKGGLGS